MAIQPDPYFALPSLRGAPAYSRPRRPAELAERPFDPDDLPLASLQTEEERRLADALVASHRLAAVGAGLSGELTGAGDAGYREFGQGALDPDREPRPRRLNLRDLTERIRARG